MVSYVRLTQYPITTKYGLAHYRRVRDIVPPPTELLINFSPLLWTRALDVTPVGMDETQQTQGCYTHACLQASCL
jgi:hypothetical protein